MKKQYVHVFHAQGTTQFSDSYLMVWLCSIHRIRHQKSKLDLMCDHYTYETLRELNINSLYDNCDINTTENALKQHHIDCKTFPAFAKFAALEKYDVPCIIDNDLIPWENLDDYLVGNTAVFSHTEVGFRGTRTYPPLLRLNTRKGYHHPGGLDRSIPAYNTSVIYIGNEEVKNICVKEAWDFMEGNCASRKKEKPEFIYVEQRLVPMCCKKAKLPIRVLIDSPWNVRYGYFQPSKEGSSWNLYYHIDNDSLLTHTWIVKKYIDQNPLYSGYICCRVLEILRKNDVQIYNVCTKMKRMLPYINMLEKYGSTEKLIKMGMVSDVLFIKDRGKEV